MSDAVKWFPVDGISDDEWRAALGDREVPHDEPYSIDRCELGVCCAVISAIRDLLYQCQEQGGLFAGDVQRLRSLCRQHEGGTWQSKPVLARVFNQLKEGKSRE